MEIDPDDPFHLLWINMFESVSGRASQDQELTRLLPFDRLSEDRAQERQLPNALASHVALVISGRDFKPGVFLKFEQRRPHWIARLTPALFRSEHIVSQP